MGSNGFESIVASMSLAENRLLVYATFDTARKGTTIVLSSRVLNKLFFCCFTARKSVFSIKTVSHVGAQIDMHKFGNARSE